MTKRPAGVSRRRLLVAAGGATLGAGLASAEDGPPPVPISLRGPALDLTSPDGAIGGLARLLAPADPLRYSYLGFDGTLFAALPGAPLRRLCSVRGLGTSRLVALEHGAGWRVLQREILYVCDPETGAVLETLRNPFTGETAAVEPLALALDDAILGAAPRQPGGSSDANPPVLALDSGRWRLEADRAVVNLPAHLTRSIRVDVGARGPGAWPERLSHLSVCSARLVDLQNPATAVVPSSGIRTTMLSWPHWLNLDPVPGCCLLHLSVSGGLENTGPLQAALVEHTRRNFPSFLAAPSPQRGI